MTEKLERWFGTLPLHHIDTSILLEPISTEDGRICKRYLQKVGYNYRGTVSLHVLGEVTLKIMLLKDMEKRNVAFGLLADVIDARNIGYFTPRNLKLAYDVLEVDARLSPTDAAIIACAVEDRVSNLITIDKKLIHNISIEKNFRIRISHPAELV